MSAGRPVGLRYRQGLNWTRRSGRAGIFRNLDLDRRNEPIASAGDGLNESGIARIIPKSFSDLEYRHSQALVEFNKGVLGPKPVPNLFSRNNLSATLDQQHQQ